MSYSWEKLKFEQHFSILLCFVNCEVPRNSSWDFHLFLLFIVIYSLFVLQKPFKMFWWIKSQYFLGVLMYLALIIQYVCLWAGVYGYSLLIKFGIISSESVVKIWLAALSETDKVTSHQNNQIHQDHRSPKKTAIISLWNYLWQLQHRSVTMDMTVIKY